MKIKICANMNAAKLPMARFFPNIIMYSFQAEYYSVLAINNKHLSLDTVKTSQMSNI